VLLATRETYIEPSREHTKIRSIPARFGCHPLYLSMRGYRYRTELRPFLFFVVFDLIHFDLIDSSFTNFSFTKILFTYFLFTYLLSVHVLTILASQSMQSLLVGKMEDSQVIIPPFWFSVVYVLISVTLLQHVWQWCIIQVTDFRLFLHALLQHSPTMHSHHE